jgi:hypothetical protein
MRFSIQVHTDICQYEIVSFNTYWYMKVHHLLTRFVPGCCSTLLARVKAAESQRPKGALVQTGTIFASWTPVVAPALPEAQARLARPPALVSQARPGLAALAHPAPRRQRDWPPGSLNSLSNAASEHPLSWLWEIHLSLQCFETLAALQFFVFVHKVLFQAHCRPTESAKAAASLSIREIHFEALAGHVMACMAGPAPDVRH